MLGGALKVEEVGSRTDEGDERHHQLLPDRIDGRVGDLGEVLLEIGIEQLGPVRHGRDRRVIAHGADGLLARLGHGRHQQLQILLGVTEGLLAIEEGHVALRAPRPGERHLTQHDLGPLQPFADRDGGSRDAASARRRR